MKRNRLGGGGGEMDSLKLAHVSMLLSRGGGGGRVEEKEHMAQPPVPFLPSARRPPSETQEAEAGRGRPWSNASRGCQAQSPRVLH
ncbi:unnamed protein product, partial [Musa acuminata var. zebrina]